MSYIVTLELYHDISGLCGSELQIQRTQVDKSSALQLRSLEVIAESNLWWSLIKYWQMGRQHL